MTNVLPVIAAAIFGLLAVLHALYTFRDWLGPRPRFFVPRDRDLTARLQATTVALAPGGHSFWQSLLGFHFSHCLGIALLCAIILRADMTGDMVLQYVAAVAATLYGVLAWRFWFRIPLIGSAVAAILLWIALLT